MYDSARNLVVGDMTSAQLNKLLKAHGWVQRNQAGSHITFKKEGVRTWLQLLILGAL